MSESGLEKIGVIGIGTMGNGIAQVAAQSGFETVVMDVDAGVLEKGLDAIGRSLDTMLFICEVLEEELGSFYKPSPLLKRLVESGHLGAKTGTGFYTWEKYKASGINPDIARYRIG